MLFLIIGGLEALIMRLQLAQSRGRLLNPEAYSGDETGSRDARCGTIYRRGITVTSWLVAAEGSRAKAEFVRFFPSCGKNNPSHLLIDFGQRGSMFLEPSKVFVQY